jgi:hypothetical protein
MRSAKCCSCCWAPLRRNMHAAASSGKAGARGISIYAVAPLHVCTLQSPYYGERERQGQLSINAAACLTHLVAGGLEFPAAQPEVCISWSPRSVLQLHPTPFSSQSSIELTFSLHLYLTKSWFQTIYFYLSKAWLST